MCGVAPSGFADISLDTLALFLAFAVEKVDQFERMCPAFVAAVMFLTDGADLEGRSAIDTKRAT